MMPIWQNKTDHLPIKQAMELISIACFIGYLMYTEQIMEPHKY